MYKKEGGNDAANITFQDNCILQDRQRCHSRYRHNMEEHWRHEWLQMNVQVCDDLPRQQHFSHPFPF